MGQALIDLFRPQVGRFEIIRHILHFLNRLLRRKPPSHSWYIRHTLSVVGNSQVMETVHLYKQKTTRLFQPKVSKCDTSPRNFLIEGFFFLLTKTRPVANANVCQTKQSQKRYNLSSCLLLQCTINDPRLSKIPVVGTPLKVLLWL